MQHTKTSALFVLGVSVTAAVLAWRTERPLKLLKALGAFSVAGAGAGVAVGTTRLLTTGQVQPAELQEE